MTDVTAIASALAGAHHAEVEQACEEALQGGLHGVLLDEHGCVGVDPTVPYGTVHEIVGHNEAWIQRHTKGAGE